MQLSARGRYSDLTEHDLTTKAKWFSTSPEVVTINPQGTVTARGKGVAIITASLGHISASIGVNVNGTGSVLTITMNRPVRPFRNPIVSLVVTPANPSIITGGTQQFTATATFTDASTQA